MRARQKGFLVDEFIVIVGLWLSVAFMAATLYILPSRGRKENERLDKMTAEKDKGRFLEELTEFLFPQQGKSILTRQISEDKKPKTDEEWFSFFRYYYLTKQKVDAVYNTRIEKWSNISIPILMLPISMIIVSAIFFEKGVSTWTIFMAVNFFLFFLYLVFFFHRLSKNNIELWSEKVRLLHQIDEKVGSLIADAEV